MSTTTFHPSQVHGERRVAGAHAFTAALVPLGRALFSAIFVMSAPTHFKAQTIAYAHSAGVPFASFLVPAAGILATLGGLSVLLGYRARLGAVFLIAFLVPVTPMMHAFWKATDPMMFQMQMVN